MKLMNINYPTQQLSFREAVINPLGINNGLFLPEKLKPLPKSVFSITDFQEHSQQVLSHLIGDEINPHALENIVKQAFNFPLTLKPINASTSVLELFHGPTFAFKDFGARFLAQCLSLFSADQKTTIITATSGDTGAAVAHAFYDLDNVDVIILYPYKKISKEQEQLFCTLGKNIHTVAIESDFDTCQSLVKQAFSDNDINSKFNLSSANSINIARLYAQVCYYTFLPLLSDKSLDYVSIPSGNFGNLTAGLIAKALGTPINHFIAATNNNDTVPRYLLNNIWEPKTTKTTLSNAMDVSNPNNFPRVKYICKNKQTSLNQLISALSISETSTLQAIKELYALGYITEPHTAVAYSALKQISSSKHHGVFLSTAHPAKFSQAIKESLNYEVLLPKIMHSSMSKQNLSTRMKADFSNFKNYLKTLYDS